MQFNMRKAGLSLFGIGMTGFLIGGSGLDGPGFATSVILTVVSFVVAAVGYKLWAVSERKEDSERAREERRRKEIEATEEVVTGSEEVAF